MTLRVAIGVSVLAGAPMVAISAARAESLANRSVELLLEMVDGARGPSEGADA